MKRRLGWRKDKYDGQDYELRPRAAIPEKIDLGGYLPTVRDQGQIGACVGFGLGGNLGACAKAAGVFLEWFSPTWIYNGARFVEGTLPYDEGCYPRNALKWLKDKGALLEHFWPYDGKALDKRNPPSSLASEAAKWPIVSYYRVTGGAEGICQALAAGHIVSIGNPWYPAWDNPPKTGALPKITKTSRTDGGHETLLYGYDRKRQVFFGQNSWGNDWGNGGRYLMPFSAIEIFKAHGGYDAHVIDVKWGAPEPGLAPEEEQVSDSKIPKTGIIIVLGAALVFILWILSHTMCGA